MTEPDASHEMLRVAGQFTTKPIDSIKRITDGAINETFEIETTEGCFILQRMSAIFSTEVMTNLDLVQVSLKEKSVHIPTCVPTTDGKDFIPGDNGYWWRALTYVPGKTIHHNLSEKGAESAAHLVGAFHSALVGFPKQLGVALPHFHDNAFYISELKKAMKEVTDEQKIETLCPIAHEVLAIFDNYIDKIPTQPKRIVHADLKVSNIRFDEDENAIALIDMDTMMEDTIAVEMGDALRSWGGVMGEDDPNQVFDESIAVAALRGYQESATNISAEEIAAIPDGVAAMTASLAIRFITDAFNESYFALSSEYPSLYKQNMVRAKNQLALLKDIEKKIDILHKTV